MEAILRFPQSQWVVVDFGSVDGTDEFLRAKLGMMPPRVIWGRALDRFEWTLPRAKNVAHAAAAGDVLDILKLMHDGLALLVIDLANLRWGHPSRAAMEQ